ncbi:MAG: carboxymuconolactone decarboxylase family protein [Microbacteriaceae bacterium]|nr:carboxymuconolactone decarboxylase family protein [Microbacteriaceae bacterium]
MTTDDERRENGMRVRREVLGDAHVDRAIAATTEDTADFQDYITRVAWGDIWSRPGLDRRSRSVSVLSALMARGAWEEVPMHLRAALRNGLTREELREVILQVGLYCGVPVANHGIALLRDLDAGAPEE